MKIQNKFKSYFLKEFREIILDFAFYLLCSVSFLSMFMLFMFSLSIIIMGIVYVIYEGISGRFFEALVLFAMSIASGILGIWLWTCMKRWRKFAIVYWKNSYIFRATSLFFFSMFPPIVLFYFPFRNKLPFDLYGYRKHLEISPLEAYPRFVLEEIIKASLEARGDRDRFLELFEERVKKPIREHPELLTEKGWSSE
ncbi:MAG: hypothetical protein K940chlam8_00056 [Chlamydiae bacterium]|nr:hypothetical protein [Chlamydiota bacterium]